MASQPESNNPQEIPTTGHEWDGIQELDNPLPRWWLWVWYACIAWSIGYWVAMPAWPLVSDYTRGLLGYSQRLALADEMKAAQGAQSAYRPKILAKSFEAIRTDPELLEFSIAGGRSAFAVNCSQCHGSGAAGFPGYPNLNDDAWLWGGSVKAIHQTIQYGIRSDHPDTRSAAMPAFLKDELLSASQVDDVAEYVLTLSSQPSNATAARRGTKVFAEQCAPCHRKTGKGNMEFGAPDLTDAIWLYGGDKATIYKTIANSRNGVMPSWETRLDPVTLKQLAIFVHSLGGGK